MSRKGQQMIKKTVKGKEIIVFIDILIDLLPYIQHRDCENEKSI
jgi:hypothetical protein